MSILCFGSKNEKKQNKRDRQFLNCGVRSETTKKKQEQEPSCTVVTKRVWLHTTILVKHEVNKTKQEQKIDTLGANHSAKMCTLWTGDN